MWPELVARLTQASYMIIPIFLQTRVKNGPSILNAPRNFFKHADADPNGTLDFDESANETLLLDACCILSEVSDRTLSEANVYLGWFSTANPALRRALSNNQIGDYAVRHDISPQDFEKFRELCGAKLLIEPIRLTGREDR